MFLILFCIAKMVLLIVFNEKNRIWRDVKNQSSKLVKASICENLFSKSHRVTCWKGPCILASILHSIYNLIAFRQNSFLVKQFSMYKVVTNTSIFNCILVATKSFFAWFYRDMETSIIGDVWRGNYFSAPLHILVQLASHVYPNLNFIFIDISGYSWHIFVV